MIMLGLAEALYRLYIGLYRRHRRRRRSVGILPNESWSNRAWHIVMAHIGLAYAVMAYIVMVYIGIAYIVMAYIAMAYIDMAYIVMSHIALRTVRGTLLAHVCRHVWPI